MRVFSSLLAPYIIICSCENIKSKLIVQAKDHLPYAGWAGQVFRHRAEHDLRAAFHRVAEYAGTDGRKGDAAQFIFLRQAQRGEGSAAQFGVFVTAAHNRADGVDDVFGLELTCRCNSRAAGDDPAVFCHPLVAGLLYFRSAPATDSPGHAAAVLQVFVGGIDEGVHRQGGNIALYEGDGGFLSHILEPVQIGLKMNPLPAETP